MSFSIRLGACPRPRPGVFDSCGWQKAYGDWIWFRDLSFDACSSLCYVGLVADHFMPFKHGSKSNFLASRSFIHSNGLSGSCDEDLRTASAYRARMVSCHTLADSIPLRFSDLQSLSPRKYCQRPCSRQTMCA